MDAVDNLIFATLMSPLQTPPGTFITSEYINQNFGAFLPLPTTPPGYFNPVFSFSLANKQTYTGCQDPSIIERAIVRHWYDINGNIIGPSQTQYNWPGPGVISDFTFAPPYHLIYSYLLENTRILQIFERVLEKYQQDEDLGITQIPLQQEVYQWIANSERLFFTDEGEGVRNIRSLIRPSYDANRRNAYYRMFGIDLAFGDISSTSGGTIPYFRARASNQQFISLFEKYLAEIWQGYINARNTSGPNTSDANNLVELAIQLQELLAARRGGRPGGGTNIYAGRNLSQEEYGSAVLLSWFTFIVSANTPVVQFLNCQSSTIGERLLKIGEKVGVPAHSKCQALFEMAGPASNILTLLETGGYLNTPANVQTMLSSLNPGTLLSIDSDNMNYFLVVINNWEKATGHRIKNPEANIRGTVSIAQPKPTNGKTVVTSN